MQKVEESVSVTSAADESAVSRSCYIIVDVCCMHSEEVQLWKVLYTVGTVYSASDVPTPVMKMKYFG
jgi:hypothetical protein